MLGNVQSELPFEGYDLCAATHSDPSAGVPLVGAFARLTL